MKLRNKKSGQIGDFMGTYNAVPFFGIGIDYHDGNPVKYEYNTLTELNEEWEDYEPAEPLIKDEKIRKAVRAWAEANNVPTDAELDVFEYLGSGVTAIQYFYKAKTLPYERCVQFEYISSDEIYNSQNDRKCTIKELCGEEE